MASAKRGSSRKTITMRDVAELANVSQSTVSRVLNGTNEPIQIGEETRQRVLEAIEELGYHPNLHAGSLRGKKTRMIAMMIADIANPFYHPMVRAVQDVAQTHRYDTMIANSDHTLNGETHFVESVIRRPVDGVIMVPYHLNDDGLDELIERTGSVVTALGQHLGHSLVDIVFADDGQATHDTVSWLHTVKAHTRIGFIGVTDKFSSAARRRQAYEKALHGVGLEVPAGYEQLGDWSPESGYAAMQKLLALPTRPTAVFACNDLMAIGAMEAAKQEGLRIPEDVAIVGFDDIPAASWVRPRLTTIAQYPTDIGKLLATALFERIEGKYSGPRRRFEVACRFIERDST